MIPLIRTLEDIEHCIKNRNAWNRPERSRVLELCKRQLDILRQAGKIAPAQYFAVNGKLLPLISEEKWREKRSTSRNRSRTETTGTTTSTPTG